MMKIDDLIARLSDLETIYEDILKTDGEYNLDTILRFHVELLNQMRAQIYDIRHPLNTELRERMSKIKKAC